MTEADDEMVRQMEARRILKGERRRKEVPSAPPREDRRKICSFCFQPGDHRNTDQCMWALGRGV